MLQPQRLIRLPKVNSVPQLTHVLNIHFPKKQSQNFLQIVKCPPILASIHNFVNLFLNFLLLEEKMLLILKLKLASSLHSLAHEKKKPN